MEISRKKDLSEKLLCDNNDAKAGANYLPTDEHTGRSTLGLFCSKLDSKTVLLIVGSMFACMAVSEMIGAVAGNSLALIGDASATCLDVITYSCNYYAECVAAPKARKSICSIEGGDNEVANQAEADRARLIHDVYVPAFSVLALVCVILAVMVFAAIEIHSGGDDETSVQMMLIFASINVVVDIVCIAIFYFRQDVILFSRPAKEGTGEPKASPTPQTNSTNTNTNTNTMFNSANLNMFAAFTHVGSDTLRTLAIFLAVLAAKTTSARSSVCDAWAAVAVSVTIFVAVLPLSREIYHAYLGVR